MQCDIEADWHLLDACNYRCDYCFLPVEQLGAKVRSWGQPRDWADAFDATGLTWLLHMTGGEPTAYPDFADLCETLSGRHFISLNSNLSRKSILDFARRIDPSRVSFINAGLHPGERERRNGLRAFLDHASALREKKFPIMISVVATPDVLARFHEIAELAKPAGLAPIPKLLRGRVAGRKYPEAYTAQERRLFREFSARARGAYEPILAARAAAPSINMFVDDKYLYAEPRFTGKKCEAGSKFVSISPDGSAYRCQKTSNLYMGNLLSRTFDRRPGAEPCNADYCMYFCLKYAEGARSPRLADRAKAFLSDRFPLNPKTL